VEVRSLHSLKAVADCLISFSDASTKMGVSSHQVNNLRMAGIIVGRKDLRGRWSIDSRSIEELERRLEAATVQNLDCETLRLSEIAALRFGALAGSLSLIVSGQIPVFSNFAPPGSPIFARFSAPKREIWDLLLHTTHRMETIKSAATLLHVTQRQMVALRRAGLLDIEEKADRRLLPNAELISSTSLMSFRANFELTRSIATKCRTNPKFVISFAKHVGISPVLRADSKKGISAIWRKTDAIQLTALLSARRP
jgi:hypothetical protein